MPARLRSTPARPTPARAAVPLVAAAVALALAGCTGGPEEPVDPAPTVTTPALASTPLEVPCAGLVDPAAVAATWPGLAVTDGPGSGAAATGVADVAVVGDLDGTVCSYADASGVVVTVAVAELDEDSLTRVANRLVGDSQAVPTYGVEGYFDRVDDRGTAEAVASPYWVVATSEGFAEPGDAEQVVAAALATLTTDRP